VNHNPNVVQHDGDPPLQPLRSQGKIERRRNYNKRFALGVDRP
jgi:hypothetical protein